jgi:hypothetical protein
MPGTMIITTVIPMVIIIMAMAIIIANGRIMATDLVITNPGR